jgi:hypothetical protein
MLLFKKKFLAAIRRGEKTQTVRLWPYRRMRVGQRSYIPGVGYIGVQAVDEVTLDALTDDDARLDGFATADALRTEIAALYDEKAAAEQRVFRVRFRVLDAAEQEACRMEKERRKRATRLESAANDDA